MNMTSIYFKLVAITVPVLFLTGCFAPNYKISKTGATDADYKEDKYECTKDASHSSSDFNTNLFIKCMEARGYTVKRDGWQ